MNIDVYTALGAKKGNVALPSAVFEAKINEGLMHQALVRQQSNKRNAIAHAKSRGEVRGSTRKLYAQKGTGRARRGSIRASILRGGGKAFGPKSIANFNKDMPKKMQRAAILSCLSVQAGKGILIGLENYPKERGTKKAAALLKKLPVELGRFILIVLSESHSELQISVRNIPNVKTIRAEYINPKDVLSAYHIIFMVDAIKKIEEMFGGKEKEENKKNEKLKMKNEKTVKKEAEEAKEAEETKEPKETKKPSTKKTSTKKPPTAKKSSPPKK